MGTPEFAVPSLRRLAESSHDVIAVVTQPDRPKGRGLRFAAAPVKKEAECLNLSIFQPEDLRHPEFLEPLRRLKGDCFIVVGFRILPPKVYEMPPKGTVNLHASLLPKYRGAAPIQWAVINGEKETGVTTFFIEKKVDTGDLILQETISIGSAETAGELHDRLAELGADLIIRTVDLIEQGRTVRIPQKGMPSLAPKILPEHCEIDWGEPAENIIHLVRGLSPRPGAFSYLHGRRLKVFCIRMHGRVAEFGFKPGRIVETSDEGISVETGKGNICIREIQIEGKRRMKTGEYLRGHELSIGTVLGKRKEDEKVESDG